MAFHGVTRSHTAHPLPPLWLWPEIRPVLCLCVNEDFSSCNRGLDIDLSVLSVEMSLNYLNPGRILLGLVGLNLE